jgi:hypothetical protein
MKADPLQCSVAVVVSYGEQRDSFFAAICVAQRFSSDLKLNLPVLAGAPAVRPRCVDQAHL